MNKFFKSLGILALAVSVIVITSAASASPSQPIFVTNTVDDTFQLSMTSAICGFPVFEHDSGTVITMVTTLPALLFLRRDIRSQLKRNLQKARGRLV